MLRNRIVALTRAPFVDVHEMSIRRSFLPPPRLALPSSSQHSAHPCLHKTFKVPDDGMAVRSSAGISVLPADGSGRGPSAEGHPERGMLRLQRGALAPGGGAAVQEVPGR